LLIAFVAIQLVIFLLISEPTHTLPGRNLLLSIVNGQTATSAFHTVV